MQEQKIICPRCKEKVDISDNQLIQAGYSKAINELRTKLDIMEIE